MRQKDGFYVSIDKLFLVGSVANSSISREKERKKNFQIVSDKKSRRKRKIEFNHRNKKTAALVRHKKVQHGC